MTTDPDTNPIEPDLPRPDAPPQDPDSPPDPDREQPEIRRSGDNPTIDQTIDTEADREA